ncbi:uncharacterized protein Dwil_GK16336 [Drosophila willistoni]|uniref:E2 ubiquitin-conjugating enzyme n=1 Tax=Drosophila willistoni TaxID=7260 RepID=B4N1M3_DROWI|nr:ubiquitin-conjugating enzyme E2 4 [Drosophila willistoni]EDW78262.1 uncharacterized protein Dwil_GK16336 [Drosophila willistoni]
MPPIRRSERVPLTTDRRLTICGPGSSSGSTGGAGGLGGGRPTYNEENNAAATDDRVLVSGRFPENMGHVMERRRTHLVDSVAPYPRTNAREVAIRRLGRELDEFRKDPPDGCRIEMVDDNMFHWLGTIIGPKGTPYENGHFRLDWSFPVDYPFAPPKVVFLTKIYHPNIDQLGSICMNLLTDDWSPVLTTSKLLLSIMSLLSDPNPNDPVDEYIANIFLTDRLTYNQNAKLWTSRYAKQDA